MSYCRGLWMTLCCQFPSVHSDSRHEQCPLKKSYSSMCIPLSWTECWTYFQIFLAPLALNFYRTQVSWSDLCVWFSLTKRRCVNLTDVTLADEDTDSILTDNTNRAIQGNVAMQVTQPGGQVCNLCKWRHLMANIRTNASDLVETKMM